MPATIRAHLIGAAFLTGVLLTACRAAIGLHLAPAAPPESVLTIRVCALLDHGVSGEQAAAVLADWNDSEGSRYALRFELADTVPVERSPWNPTTPMAIVRSTRLDPHCDRILYFVSAGPLEYAWGVAAVAGLPILLGEVDDETGSRGWIQTRWISPLLQVLLWMPPPVVARHELFHFLGCPHAFTRVDCDSRIAALRSAAVLDFFPAMSPLGQPRPILQTRAEVEAALVPRAQPTEFTCGGVVALFACRAPGQGGR